MIGRTPSQVLQFTSNLHNLLLKIKMSGGLSRPVTQRVIETLEYTRLELIIFVLVIEEGKHTR